MKRKATWQKLRTLGSFCLILLLLPYIVTVFVHGKDFEAFGKREGLYVNVRKPEASSGLSQIGATPGAVETGAVGNVSGMGNHGTGREEVFEIVQIPWEEYFIGIMGKEVPADAETELLKAQAVLLRTKLYQELDAQGGSARQSPEESGQQSPIEAGRQPEQDSAPEQKVLEEGYLTRQELEEKAGTSQAAAYYDDLVQAMEETDGQVLFYQDDYASVPFHQSSNGRTRSAQEVLGVETCPYLAVRDCPLDKGADEEMQISTFEYKDVQAKCQSFLVAVPEEEAGKTYQFSDFEIISHDSAGYVMQMRIGETVCTGDQFRDALSLASSAFSIKDADGRLRVTTMGRGHGLGLSQWTAQQMAKEGKNYEEILQFFFEGTDLADGGPVKEKLE